MRGAYPLGRKEILDVDGDAMQRPELTADAARAQARAAEQAVNTASTYSTGDKARLRIRRAADVAGMNRRSRSVITGLPQLS